MRGGRAAAHPPLWPCAALAHSFTDKLMVVAGRATACGGAPHAAAWWGLQSAGKQLAVLRGDLRALLRQPAVVLVQETSLSAPAFIQTLFEVVDNKANAHIIRWESYLLPAGSGAASVWCVPPPSSIRFRWKPWKGGLWVHNTPTSLHCCGRLERLPPPFPATVKHIWGARWAAGQPFGSRLPWRIRLSRGGAWSLPFCLHPPFEK
jgi:hypothetical protein